MTVVTVMAEALDQELQARGIFGLGRTDCEAIMTAVLQRTAAAANANQLTKEEGEEITRRST